MRAHEPPAPALETMMARRTGMVKLLYRLLESPKFLQDGSLFEDFQSGLRDHHCTERALVKVTSDLFTVSAEGLISILVLLALSAPLYPMDHHILLQTMEHKFDIKDLL